MGNYSSGDEATLPTGTDDLEHIYDATDLSNVQADDTNYVEQTATNQYPIHQYKDTITAATANITWKGKSDQAPSTYPVYLQVYKTAVPTGWVELDKNNSASAGVDFTLQELGFATADYKDGSNVMIHRVYQDYSAGAVETQVLFGGLCTNTLPTTAGTIYYNVFSSATSSGTETAVGAVMAAAGTISNFEVIVSTEPGASNSWTFTVMKNGSPTDIVVAITQGLTTASDTSHTASYVGGDTISVQIVTVAGGTLPTANGTWSYLFTPSSSGETNLLHGSGSTNLSVSATEYIGCHGLFSTTLFQNQYVLPCNGTITGFYGFLSAAPGVGITRTLALNVDGSDDGSCKLAYANESGAKSWTGSVSVTAGQKICTSSTMSASGTGGKFRGGFIFKPVGGAGYWILTACSRTATTNASTARFTTVNGATSNTESATNVLVPVTAAFTAKAIYAEVSTDPGSGKSYAIAFAVGGTADGDLVATITGNGSNGVSANASHDVDVTDAQTIEVRTAPSGTPASVNLMHSILAYKAPA